MSSGERDVSAGDIPGSLDSTHSSRSCIFSFAAKQPVALKAYAKAAGPCVEDISSDRRYAAPRAGVIPASVRASQEEAASLSGDEQSSARDKGSSSFLNKPGDVAPSSASCLAPPVKANGCDHEILPATTRFYRSRRPHVIFSARLACPRPGNGSKRAEKERKAECLCCSRHLSRSTKGAGLGAEFGRRRSAAASVSACACLAPRRGRAVT